MKKCFFQVNKYNIAGNSCFTAVFLSNFATDIGHEVRLMPTETTIYTRKNNVQF